MYQAMGSGIFVSIVPNIGETWHQSTGVFGEQHRWHRCRRRDDRWCAWRRNRGYVVAFVRYFYDFCSFSCASRHFEERLLNVGLLKCVSLKLMGDVLSPLRWATAVTPMPTTRWSMICFATKSEVYCRLSATFLRFLLFCLRLVAFRRPLSRNWSVTIRTGEVSPSVSSSRNVDICDVMIDDVLGMWLEEYFIFFCGQGFKCAEFCPFSQKSLQCTFSLSWVRISRFLSECWAKIAKHPCSTGAVPRSNRVDALNKMKHLEE